METVELRRRILFNNLLYLTDFSEASEVALPFAIEIARAYGAKIFALNALIPSPVVYMSPESPETAIEWQEESAVAEMQRVEAQLVGLPHETIVERGTDLWAALRQVLTEHEIDLMILGTHGRTGMQKLILGSAAEEIFRRSPIPVVTIGPSVRSSSHKDARFKRVLFPTDFTEASLAAAPYAISLAQENQARLILLHVIRHLNEDRAAKRGELSVAEAMHQLFTLVPADADLWCRPEPAVQYGEPGEQILSAANERGADLIVLGVRGSTTYSGAATHVTRATAYNVVAHAECPVLTVRS
jgi:nucleotide-binding universal stress UspA family protein